MKKVLFVCVENAGRSQMMEAFAKNCGGGKIDAASAGTVPSSEVGPVVIQAVGERGIDIPKNRPKPLNAKMVQEAEMLITMGCDAQPFCPAPLLNKVAVWNLEDPKEKPTEKVRQIRDEIERRVKNLINTVC